MEAHGVVSTLIFEDLNEIRERYGFGDEHDLQPAGVRYASDPPNGYCAVYYEQLTLGLRFPPCPVLLAVLKEYQLALSQLCPHSVRFIIGFAIWCRLAKRIFTVQLFRSFFMIKHHGGHFYYVCRRSNAHTKNLVLVAVNVATFDEWKRHFFFVKSKHKKRKGSNRRLAAIDVSENSSASWEGCSLKDLKEKYISFNSHVENRLLKAIQDELELQKQLEELKIEKETLETSKNTLDQALTNLQNDHVNLNTRISDLEKQALEKDNDYAALQKEADEAKSQLTQALKDLGREKSLHEISRTTAMLDYKASHKGHKEVELIMHPFMHYFYTLGADDSSAVNGDLAKLKNAEYYASGQDTEIDTRFDDWKAGVDMISRYAPDSIEGNSSV